MVVLSSTARINKLSETMPDISLKEVRKLACSENSCIAKKEKEIQLLIQPCYVNCLKKGVKVAMDNLTIGFSQHLGGLILGYENVKVLPWSGSVHSTNPLVHLHVRATFYVFAPTKGVLIEGIVNKVTPHMVSFLAYNKYNIIYRVHQVQQGLKQQADRSRNSKTAEIAKLVLQHLQDLSLTEGVSCTLLLQEVALRDFLPSLQGYPVPAGLDVSCLCDESVVPQAAEPSRKRVRFSDEESVSSTDLQPSEQPLPPLTSDCKREELSPLPLNSDQESSDPIEPPRKKSPKKKTKSSKVEDTLIPNAVVKEEVVSPIRSLHHDASQSTSIGSDPSQTKKQKNDGTSPLQSTYIGSESLQTKKKKKKSRSKDGAVLERAELAAVIESSRLCHAGDHDQKGLVSNDLDLTNGDLELLSPVKKNSKRKRDDSSEGEFLQKPSKRSKKSNPLIQRS